MTSTGSERGGRVGRLVAVLLCGLVLVGGAAVAERATASHVPITSTTLLAGSLPTGAITSTFTYPSATSLATTVDACGQRWTVSGGTMQITGGTVAATTTGLVTAAVPMCGLTSVNAEAGGTVTAPVSGGFGVLVNAGAGGRPSTAAVYRVGPNGNASVQLLRISTTGTTSAWAQVNNVGSMVTRHLKVTYLNGVYAVSLGGTNVLTYTVPDAATRTAVEQYTGVGIVANSDTRPSIDDFQAYPR